MGTYIIAFMISFVVTVVTTPMIKWLAHKWQVVDAPNFRRINKQSMPSMGGLSVLLGFIAGYIYLWPVSSYTIAILLGAMMMAITGIIDDKWTLKPKFKLLAEVLAAIIVVASGLEINFVNIPLIGEFHFGWLSIPITIFWIVGITNAINLIDGLDGLASGVSSIALATLLVMAIIDVRMLALALSVILLAASLGFLLFNRYPAKIFMGDTGALFIGYMIAVISVTGLFKSLTLFSLVLPVLILGVPVLDTSFAIIRRLLKNQKVSTPDKSHLHHYLLALGFSHQATVYIIYTISILFAAAAIILSKSLLWGAMFIGFFLLIMLEFTLEIVGFWKQHRTPLINTVKKIVPATEGHNK